MSKILFLILFISVVVLCFPLPTIGANQALIQMTVNITSFEIPARMAAIGDLVYTISQWNPQDAFNQWYLPSNTQVEVVKNDTGTISVNANGTAVTGMGTHFKEDFTVGQYISTISATSNNVNYSESHVITAISDDAHMTTGTWAHALTNSVYSGPEESQYFTFPDGEYIQQGGGNYYMWGGGPDFDSPYTMVPVSFPYDSNWTYSVYLEVPASSIDNQLIGCKADCSNVPAGSGWFFLGLDRGPAPLSDKINYDVGACTPPACDCGFYTYNNDCGSIALDPKNIIKESDSASKYQYNCDGCDYTGAGTPCCGNYKYFWRVLIGTI